MPFTIHRSRLFALAGTAAALAGGVSLSESAARERSEALPTRLIPGGFPAPVLPRPVARHPVHTVAVHPVAARVSYGEAAARFGYDRGDHIHEGQDVFAPTGTPLVAISDGVVLETGGGDARGNYLAIYDRPSRRTYVYLHMQEAATVRVGQRLRAGQPVGRLGCTGSCFGPHLHFEVRLGRGVKRRAIDPLPLLRRWPRSSIR